MNLWKSLKTFDSYSNGSKILTLRVVVEIPKGSDLKYEYESSCGYFTIVRKMHPKYKYIYNYGMIPQTEGGDRDPLDAIVIYPKAIPTGTVLNCKILGVVKMIDNGEEDHKILCIPYFYKQTKINIKKIIRYLNSYKFPNQKGTEVKGIAGPTEAISIIKTGIKTYKEKYL